MTLQTREHSSRAPIADDRLARIVVESRAETVRLERLDRGLTVAGVAGLLIASVGGVFGMFAPVPSDRNLAIAIALGFTVVVSVGLLAWGSRVRRRLERHRHGCYRLAFAEEVLNLGRAASEAEHPYRASDEAPAARRRVERADHAVPTADPFVPLRTRSSSVRQGVTLAALAGALVVIGGLFTGGPQHSGQRWMFLEAATTPAELGFHASAPRGGPWAVESHEHATGARALVNREGEDEAPPAILVAHALWTRDFKAVTRCRTSAARAVQQCGVVFRFRDASNYSVAKLDSVDGSVVLADVVDGDENPLARSPAEAPPNTWHELRVEAQAGLVRIFWNSRQVVERAEVVPAAAGRIGLWVPASGVAYFDELSIEGLMDSPRSLEVLPFLARSRS